jgi:AcrR family transcriptional regulator
MAEPARTTLTERRAQELRVHIAQTAAALFVEENSTAVTVERIAEAAGVHPRTFHRHFPAKEDVLEPLFAQRTVLMVSLLRDAPTTGDPVETIIETWAPVIAYDPVNASALPLLRLIMASQEYRFRWLQMDDQIVDAVTEFLDRRSLLPDEAVLRTLPAALVVAATRHVFEQWVATGARADVPHLLRRALRTVLDGVNPPR